MKQIKKAKNFNWGFMKKVLKENWLPVMSFVDASLNAFPKILILLKISQSTTQGLFFISPP